MSSGVHFTRAQEESILDTFKKDGYDAALAQVNALFNHLDADSTVYAEALDNLLAVNDGVESEVVEEEVSPVVEPAVEETEEKLEPEEEIASSEVVEEETEETEEEEVAEDEDE